MVDLPKLGFVLEHLILLGGTERAVVVRSIVEIGKAPEMDILRYRG